MAKNFRTTHSRIRRGPNSLHHTNHDRRPNRALRNHVPSLHSR
jgi:hypothetical protein